MTPTFQPAPVPEPVPGCATCAALDKQRAAAAATHDPSQVSDCNVRMRRHPDHGTLQPS